MKCISILVLGLSLLESSQSAYAQDARKKYLVFTFEDMYKESPHGTQTYYWIQPIDFINTGALHLDKLVLSGYSVSELQDCCMGKAINPYTGTDTGAGSSMYIFGKNHYLAIDTLERIVKKNRRRIKVTSKEQMHKIYESVSIYVTPVEGIFCFSKFTPLRTRENEYKNSISIPYSTFSYYKAFWLDKKYKIILKIDYSAVPFSILPADK